MEVAVKRMFAGEHIKTEERSLISSPWTFTITFFSLSRDSVENIRVEYSIGIFVKRFLTPARHSRALKLKARVEWRPSQHSTTFQFPHELYI